MFGFLRRKPVQSIQSIEPGPLLGKLRQIAIGPNKETEELKKEKLLNDFLSDIGSLQSIKPEETISKFKLIFNDRNLLEEVFKRANAEERKLIFEMSLLHSEGFSDFIASKLDKESLDYKLALELVISMEPSNLEYHIRRLNIYGSDIKRFAEALLIRADRDIVINIVERAVFNPERFPEIDENDNYADALRFSRMLMGNYYREPQSLYLRVIEKLAPDYDLSKLKEFYRIAIEDGNKGSRTWLKEILIDKYKKDDVRKLFLNIVNDESLEDLRYLRLKKQALWYLVELLGKDSVGDLLRIVKEENASVGIEAVKALCDESVSGTKGQELLIKMILDDVKRKDSSEALFILAMAKEPYKIGPEYLSSGAEILSRMYGSKNPFINGYIDIVEILLKNIENITQAVNNKEVKLTESFSDDFNKNLSPARSLINNIGFERLAIYVTQTNTLPEMQILKKNAQRLLELADNKDLKYFLDTNSKGAKLLKRAIGIN